MLNDLYKHIYLIDLCMTIIILSDSNFTLEYRVF